LLIKATLAFSIYLQNTIPSPLNGTANQNKKYGSMKTIYYELHYVRQSILYSELIKGQIIKLVTYQYLLRKEG